MNESKPHGLHPAAMVLRQLELPADLATEVAWLRKEIAALQSELKPMPSWLVTGQQAVDEFKRLAVAMPEIAYSKAIRMNSNARCRRNMTSD